MTYHIGNVSTNFSWHEVEKSETAERMGIDNSLPALLEDAASNTAFQMEKVRALLQKPIIVDSWYRSPELQLLPAFYNPTSQHPRAEAVDFVSPGYGDPIQICKSIISFPELIKFDQIILEHTWVHISFSSIKNGPQRRQILSLLENKKYAVGLTDKNGRPV